jgi:tryptophan-rich sensory protein
MLKKVLMIFGIGLMEQCLYTAYLISVTKRQTVISSVLMLIYMSLYLFIVAFALKDTNAVILLITYALACGLGNYITMRIEKRNEKK